jgi:hypothetical protein
LQGEEMLHIKLAGTANILKHPQTSQWWYEPPLQIFWDVQRGISYQGQSLECHVYRSLKELTCNQVGG